MPEHETYDLDAAFARLEQDLSTLSRGPGADRAVSTARRRRRTTVAAVAAVAIVAVGGVVAGHTPRPGPRGRASATGCPPPRR